MKQLFLILLLVGGITHHAVAQQYEYGPEIPVKSKGGKTELRKTRFGVFFAPNISWMKPTANKSDDRYYIVSSQGSKVGYTWGLMADYYFSENYAIATGFQISKIGGKILATENLQVTQTNVFNIVRSADFSYNTQYLEIPVNLKLRSDALNNGMRIFGQIGLSLGINISKKATYDVMYSDTAGVVASINRTVTGENEKLQGSLAIAPAMLSMNVGGGVEYPITDKMSLYFALLFNNGFAPDATNPKRIDMDYKGEFSDGNVRLNNFALRIGIFF